MSISSRLINHLELGIEKVGHIQAERLFHGRGHAYIGLHHITIDWLPPVALITLFKAETSFEINILADYLFSHLPDCHSVQLQHRYQLSGPIDVIKGELIHQLVIKENNLLFHISLGQVRNMGLFLDMKNGRQWVQDNCKNKRVLNLFAYTCGFSVAAVAGNAKSILNVDMSGAGLNTGRENHRLNQQALDDVSFEKINIFKSFGRLKRRGPFDFLICDPPTFQKGSVNIVRDYPKILRRLDDFMAPKGTLMLCLNALELDRNFLIGHMKELPRYYTLIDEIQPPEAYVEAENKGLKVLCFKNME